MNLPETYSDFEQALQDSTPPAIWPEGLKALWFIAKGNWEASHDIAQELHTPVGSLIHGHLHRVEGDDWNAKYWYRKAGKSYPTESTSEELKNIIKEMLQNGS